VDDQVIGTVALFAGVVVVLLPVSDKKVNVALDVIGGLLIVLGVKLLFGAVRAGDAPLAWIALGGFGVWWLLRVVQLLRRYWNYPQARTD
jgi:hypothetical protein